MCATSPTVLGLRQGSLRLGGFRGARSHSPSLKPGLRRECPRVTSRNAFSARRALLAKYGATSESIAHAGAVHVGSFCIGKVPIWLLYFVVLFAAFFRSTSLLQSRFENEVLTKSVHYEETVTLDGTVRLHSGVKALRTGEPHFGNQRTTPQCRGRAFKPSAPRSRIDGPDVGHEKDKDAALRGSWAGWAACMPKTSSTETCGTTLKSTTSKVARASESQVPQQL